MVARGLEANDEARQRGTTHNVLCQHGHQDGLRCGTTKHIAKIMGDHDVHGWIAAASLREMAGLEGQGKFESVESTFSVLKIATQILGNVESEWVKTAKDNKHTNTRVHKIKKKHFKILGFSFNDAGRTLDCIEERMQNADKAWWSDVKIYRSKRRAE